MDLHCIDKLNPTPKMIGGAAIHVMGRVGIGLAAKR